LTAIDSALWAVVNAARRVDTANSMRAAAQVQDSCVRQDYETSMGAALDEMRLSIDKLDALVARRT
jgi:hypothetical protein